MITLTPTEPGEFGIICNEFCGVGHHMMLGKVIVTEADGTVPGQTASALEVK